MKGKRACMLVLCLCLLAGCARRGGEKKGPTATPPPTVAPTPTAAPTPEPVETAEPTPTPPPKQELPLGAMLLLELEETDRVMDKAAGDLNGDGLTDWAVVVERLSEVEEPGEYFTDAPRTLAILLGDGVGGYTLGQTNDRFIRRDTQGGVYGDPYEGISIQDGELYYGAYGGSSLRWVEDYTFHWAGNGLELKTFCSISFWTYGSCRDSRVYDFTAGEYREYAAVLSEEGLGRLVWEQDLPVAPSRLEEEGSPWEGEPWIETPPLPSLDNGYLSAPPIQSPETLLDKAKESYHPDMWRVEIPWTEETRTNYSDVVGYPVPGYYYTDGKAVLYYGGVEAQGEDQRPYLHSVWYKDEDWENVEIYHYLDETGEEWGTNP